MLKNKWLSASVVTLSVCALFTVGFGSTAAASVSDNISIRVLEEEKNTLIQTTYEDVQETVAEQKRIAEEEAAKEAEREAARLAAIEQAEREAREAKAAQEALEAQENLRLMAAIIFCEAGNQSYEGQVAVGAVVMNRVKSSAYPNSIREVIYQSGQFTPAMTGWLDQVLASGSYTDSAMQAAKDALAGANPVGDCLYFDQGSYGMQIGAHFFH